MCSGHNLCSSIRKYFHGTIWKTGNIKRLNLNTIFQTAIYHFWTRWYIKTRATLYRQLFTENPLIHAHSGHPKSLKRCIPYSQALRIKTICSTLTEYKKHCAILKQNFIESEYEENILKDEIDKVDNIDRRDLSRKK